MKLQLMQSKGMLSHGRVADFMRPKVFKILRHTPMFTKTNYRIAYGNPAIRVRPELFIHAWHRGAANANLSTCPRRWTRKASSPTRSSTAS